MDIHDELDQWLDGVLPEIFKDGHEPTLEEMSDLITRTRQQFMGEWLPILIREKYSDHLEQEYAPCPQCGKMHGKRLDSAKALRTMQGEGKISRPWFYCNDCELGYAPLDETLEISRKKIQLDVQKRATKLSAEVTFQRGEDLFQELTGQRISDHCLYETFEAVGAETRIEEVIPSRKDIEERIKKATRSTWRPILVVASDGVHLPTRPKASRKGKRGPGQWQEAKGFRIYLMGVDSIIHLAGWHQIQNEEAFGQDLALAASRIPQDQVRIALLGDGADWLWKHMTACFPEGREILDYYHCAEHIHKVGNAIRRRDTGSPGMGGKHDHATLFRRGQPGHRRFAQNAAEK
jgi:ASC-1-like (ASCH) protein